MMNRTGFLWILVSMLAYGAFHSLLASLVVKNWVQRLLGVNVLRYYRLLFNIIAIVSLLPVLMLVVLLPDQRIYTVPFPWALINLAVMGCAILGLLLGVRQTGASRLLGLMQITEPQQSEIGDNLVVQGFYHYVRHPLYFFGLVFVWFTPFMSWNLLAFNLATTAYVILGAMLEESKLLREFGDSYAAYQQITPMLIPCFRRRTIKSLST